jgi:flagellar motor protein MotB
MSKREKEDTPAKVDDQAWMGTLADLVFLLITFFVLLISMSSLNSKKLKEAFGLFDSAVDVMNFPKEGGGSDSFVNVISSVTNFMAEKSKESKITDEKKEAAAKQLLQEMAAAMGGNVDSKSMIGSLKTLAQKVEGVLNVEKVDDGFAVELPGRILFPARDLTLTESGVEFMKDVAAILRLWGGNVDVVCHWSWHEASQIQSQIIEVLERNGVRGNKIHPKIFPISKRTIRFVMRGGE